MDENQTGRIMMKHDAYSFILSAELRLLTLKKGERRKTKVAGRPIISVL